MKVNTNPNITNNKTKISSYNNIPRNKKELVTIITLLLISIWLTQV